MDYTPTTTEVRNAFTFSMGSGDENNSCFPANRAAFDRWLAEVKAQAWEEGYDNCFDLTTKPGDTYPCLNPYRQEEN